MQPNPVHNRDFFLKRTLKIVMMRAAIIERVEAAVRICPITPTGCPKVVAISIRSSPDAMFGGETANLAIANAGRRNLPLVFFSDSDKLSSTFSPRAFYVRFLLVIL